MNAEQFPRDPRSPDQPHLYNPDARPEYTPAMEITVRDVCTAFVEQKRADFALGMFKEKSLDRAVRRATCFAAEFGDMPVSKCKQQILISWISDHTEWDSSHTKSDVAGVIVSCFIWAAQQGMIPHSPFMRPKKAWPPLLPRVAISTSEYCAIMKAAKNRGYRRARSAFRVAMFFLWETGARTCEMRELRWDQIDFATGIASLSEHKTARSSGQARLIVLTPKVWRLLRWIKNRRNAAEADAVFLNSQRRPWNVSRFAKYFHKCAEKAGVRLKLSPYSLRHGFTVRGLENGVGERQLADLLGHSTTRYISWYGRSTRAHGDYLRGVLGQVHREK